MNVQLINFRGSAFCRYRLYSCLDAFPMFSAELHTGSIYHFISDFACGSWAAVSCIGGKGKIDPFSRVNIDYNTVKPKNMRNITGCVAEKNQISFVHSSRKSVKRLIDDALRNSNIEKSADEIKELFGLTDGRFNRPLGQCSGEIFTISMAIQYAKGKKIVCFPWISEFEMNRIEGSWRQIELMKKNDVMILIPSSHNSFLDSVCDGSICFNKEGVFVDI